jgi:hypothetical protein
MFWDAIGIVETLGRLDALTRCAGLGRQLRRWNRSLREVTINSPQTHVFGAFVSAGETRFISVPEEDEEVEKLLILPPFRADVGAYEDLVTGAENSPQWSANPEQYSQKKNSWRRANVARGC